MLQPQHAPPSSALSVGDIAPSWVFTKSDGSHFSLGSDSIAGNPLVLFFSLGVDALQSKASALFASSADAFGRLGARIVTVVRDRPASPTAAGLPSPGPSRRHDGHGPRLIAGEAFITEPKPSHPRVRTPGHIFFEAIHDPGGPGGGRGHGAGAVAVVSSVKAGVRADVAIATITGVARWTAAGTC